MRVLCKKIYKNGQNLTIGKQYHVVSITIANRGAETEISFRLINDDNRIIVYPASSFDIVDPNFGSDYVFKLHRATLVEILPESISYDGFWEKYWGDENEEEVALIQALYPDINKDFD